MKTNLQSLIKVHVKTHLADGTFRVNIRQNLKKNDLLARARSSHRLTCVMNRKLALGTNVGRLLLLQK